MNTQTKAERNEIYKTMLRYIKTGGFQGCEKRIMSLCSALSSSVKFYTEINNFPELIKHKPKTFYTYYGSNSTHDVDFWFPCTDAEPRIKILEQAIKETEV